MSHILQLDSRLRFIILSDGDKTFPCPSRPSRIEQVNVPSTFAPPKALYKARALEYFRQHQELTDDDWVLHLDEETLVDEHCIQTCITFIENTSYEFGQGIILYNTVNYYENYLLVSTTRPQARPIQPSPAQSNSTYPSSYLLIDVRRNLPLQRRSRSFSNPTRPHPPYNLRLPRQLPPLLWQSRKRCNLGYVLYSRRFLVRRPRQQGRIWIRIHTEYCERAGELYLCGFHEAEKEMVEGNVDCWTLGQGYGSFMGYELFGGAYGCDLLVG